MRLFKFPKDSIVQALRVAGYAWAAVFLMASVVVILPTVFSRQARQVCETFVGGSILVVLLAIHALSIYLFDIRSLIKGQGGIARYLLAAFFFLLSGALIVGQRNLVGVNLGLAVAILGHVLLLEAASPSAETEKRREEERAKSDALRRHRSEAKRIRRRVPYEEAIHAARSSGSRVLSEREVDNAQQLICQGTEDALTLVAATMRACTPADIATVFGPAVVYKLVYTAHPACLHIAAGCIASVTPCLRLLAFDLRQRLMDRDEEDFIHPGTPVCRPVAARQDLYKVLLEEEFPPRFVAGLRSALTSRLGSYVFNYNMSGSWYEWVFTGESLTKLSTEGAQVLAGLSVVEPVKEDPIWGNAGRELGAYLRLPHVRHLTKAVAGALSRSRRSILFGNLEAFPDTRAHIRLARSLARQEQVVLGPRTQVSPVIAEILAFKFPTP